MQTNVSHSCSCTYIWNSRKEELLGELLNEGGVGLKTVLSLQLFEVEKNLINLHY